MTKTAPNLARCERFRCDHSIKLLSFVDWTARLTKDFLSCRASRPRDFVLPAQARPQTGIMFCDT
jgi:hypothetical protein